MEKDRETIRARIEELYKFLGPTKQRAFVDYYLQSWNGKRAAEQAGFEGDDHQLAIQGWNTLHYEPVQELIHLRMLEAQMDADEVLYRLALQARASAADFYDLDPTSGLPVLNLKKAQKFGLLAVLKRIRPTPSGWDLELYDAQNALVQIGKFHKLFTEKFEVEEPLDDHTVEDLEQRANRITAVLEAARARRNNEARGDKQAVDPEEHPTDPSVLQSGG